MNRCPRCSLAPLPLLLWAAMRFGLAGVSWGYSALPCHRPGVLHGRGPFASSAPAENILHLQFFLLTISLPLMVLAAVSQERYQAFSALSRSEQEVRRQYATRHSSTTAHRSGLPSWILSHALRQTTITWPINGRPADAHLGGLCARVLPHLADTIEPLYQRRDRPAAHGCRNPRHDRIPARD